MRNVGPPHMEVTRLNFEDDLVSNFGPEFLKQKHLLDDEKGRADDF